MLIFKTVNLLIIFLFVCKISENIQKYKKFTRVFKFLVLAIYSIFTIIYDKEKHQIITFKKLKLKRCVVFFT